MTGCGCGNDGVCAGMTGCGCGNDGDVWRTARDARDNGRFPRREGLAPDRVVLGGYRARWRAFLVFLILPFCAVVVRAGTIIGG